MTVSKTVLLVATTLCVAMAWGQSNRKEPHIGYLYPSGGQRGAVFQITIGGQYLRGVSDIYISGEGVRASVIQHFRPLKNLDREQRLELQRQLKELTAKRLAELPRRGRGLSPLGQQFGKNKKNADQTKAPKKKNATTTQQVKLPDHPLLLNLEKKSLRELQHVRNEFFNLKKRQPNAQLAESVLIEMTIDPKAAPGDREIRLGTPFGLTNPMCFQVGLLPETCEQEPNDPKAYTTLPEEPPINLPILMNGQIRPGDVDRFRFRAKRGQQLVIETKARHLIPYLADAVPGWFQATLALYDDKGNRVAFADDYRFDPDPVLLYKIPETGEYDLEIRDSIYRGREDFVYRVAVGEQPFITQAFPLGGRMGTKTVASIDGWNLSRKRFPLDTLTGTNGIRQMVLHRYGRLSNRVPYAVDTLPEDNEIEPNNTPRDAQGIELPRIINGRIAQPGDVDVFQFKGTAGDEVVAEVFGRRLHSPLDSLLRLTDALGHVLAWNDDHEDKASGLCTHHADSYLCSRLPKDGVYYAYLADSQHHGGEAYGYRLRMGPPQPDFALRVTPSSLNMRVGGAVPVCVHVIRTEGFDGDIELVLKDAPAGFTLSGGKIPTGRDRVRMTLTAPREPLNKPMVLQLEGRASIGGQTVRRPAVPAEDMMQAFLYRHLVPSQELMVQVTGKKPIGPPVELANRALVRVPAGSTAEVRIKTPRRPMLQDIELELREPPEGITLQDVTVVPEGLAFLLKADGDTAQVGLADNLIVEAFAETTGRKRGDKARKQKRRVSLGVLPAISFEIVP